MSSPNEKLGRALPAFRREQALAYLHQLSGSAAPGRAAAARTFLTQAATLSLVEEARRTGELSPHEHAALAAHIARAYAEARYEEGRRAALALPSQQGSLAGERQSLGTLLREWLSNPSWSARMRIEAALEEPLGEHAQLLTERRARADAAAAGALSVLKPLRHPDAGPEQGSAKLAEQWLSQSADLAQEAFAQARQATGTDAEHGLATLWACLAPPLRGLFRSEGRFRRLSEELAPLGLRDQLARAGRLAPAHPVVSASPHVLVLAAPGELRISPSQLDAGLASELFSAEALGRATAHAHASPSLPYALRHASAATVARSMGSLSMLRFSEPQLLRKRRGLSAREASEVARLSSALVLMDLRLAAAALLARGLVGHEAQGRAQPLAERALLGPVPPGTALFLLTRLSAGSAFRGKLYGPGLAAALRERFDVDWYENPRAGEPLRGAFARAGDFSVESFAEELGAQIEAGLAKLSELF